MKNNKKNKNKIKNNNKKWDEEEEEEGKEEDKANFKCAVFFFHSKCIKAFHMKVKPYNIQLSYRVYTCPL